MKIKKAETNEGELDRVPLNGAPLSIKLRVWADETEECSGMANYVERRCGLRKVV